MRPVDLEGWDPVAREIKARILGRARHRLTAQDLHDWVDDGPAALPQAEIAWFLPRRCRLMAAGHHCCGTLGWRFALSWARRGGYPDAWPATRAEALAGFAAALGVEAAVTAPDAATAGDIDDEEAPGWATLLAMVVEGGLAVEPVLARLATLPGPVIDRMLAGWTLAEPLAFDLGVRPVDALVAGLFIAPQPAGVLGDWLEGLEPADRLARAAERERDGPWADEFEAAAALWAGTLTGAEAFWGAAGEPAGGPKTPP
ncbi:MAG: hypothetical protein AAFZ09_07390 [Pseudomonadota bacterium]